MIQLLRYLFFVSLTVYIVSDPPHVAESQPNKMPPIMSAVQQPQMDSTRTAGIDSVNKSAAILEQTLEDATKEVSTLKRNTTRLLHEVKKDRDPSEGNIIVIASTPDTVKEKECVLLRDSVYSSLPFWKKHKILVKQCTIKRDIKNALSKLFKRKK